MRARVAAEHVRSRGRGGDTELIHVNPHELAVMHRAWGEPSTNPDTGLPEYGFFSKLGKTLKFELSHMKKVTKEIIKNPKRTLTGPTPLGTKINNKIFGENKKPLTGQLGGSTQEDRNAYEVKHGKGSLGYANETNAVANAIAGWYAGGALSGLGQAGSAVNMAGQVGAKLLPLATTYADNGLFKPSGPTLGDGTPALEGDTSGTSMVPWSQGDKPLRRFQRTPETIFKNFRATGGNPT